MRVQLNRRGPRVRLQDGRRIAVGIMMLLILASPFLYDLGAG